MTPSDYRAVVVTMPARQRISDGMVLLPNAIGLHPGAENGLAGMIVTPVSRPASDLDAAERDATIATLRAELDAATSARISAEMSAADARAGVDATTRPLRRQVARLEEAQRGHAAKLAEVRAESERASGNWSTRAREIEEALRRLAAVYGLEEEFVEATTDWFDPEEGRQLLGPAVLSLELVKWADRLADETHPAVAFPVIGERVLLAAEVAARGVLGSRPGTVTEAVRAALTEAVNWQRNGIAVSGEPS